MIHHFPIFRGRSRHDSFSPKRCNATIVAVSLALGCYSNLSAAPSTTVIISQVYAAGGLAGASYLKDFVELHNISASPVSLDGRSLQFANPATGSFTLTGSTLTVGLTGIIVPGGYYLISLGSPGSVGASLPVADATGSERRLTHPGAPTNWIWVPLATCPVFAGIHFG